MFIFAKGDHKVLYDPILSDLAKIIGAKNIFPTYEEIREATPEEAEVGLAALKRDSNPIFFRMKEEKNVRPGIL